MLKVDNRKPGEKLSVSEKAGCLFSDANLLYASPAGGCHLGLHVVTAGVVVGGTLRVVVVGVLDVVGLTL